MSKSHFNDCSYAIIGAYYEVYNHTSRTFPEYIYERAMIEELRQRGLHVTCQDEYEIVYKGRRVGIQRLDLFIAGEIVVENKAADQLTRLHKAQCISYLKTVNKQTGLLLNFGGQAPEFNRLYFDPAKEPTNSIQTGPAEPGADWLYPDLAYRIVGGLYEVHHHLGAGFVHRIYANACCHELRLRGLAVQPGKRLLVSYKDVVIGDIAFAHLLVEAQIMVFPVAIGRLEDIQLENLKQWLTWRNLKLGILANFDAVRLEVMFIRT